MTSRSAQNATGAVQTAQRETGGPAGPEDEAPLARAQRASAVRKPVVREDRRRAATIGKILDAVTLLVHRQGTETLTVQAVCERAGISRGAFYRYFDSKEGVLQAWFDEMLRHNENAINALIAGNPDVDARLSAYVAVVTELMDRHRFRSLVQVEPALAIRLLESKYWQQIERTGRALSVVYDSWEEVLGMPINRQLLSELILRCQLSTTLIPTQLEAGAVVDHIKALLAALRERKA